MDPDEIDKLKFGRNMIIVHAITSIICLTLHSIFFYKKILPVYEELHQQMQRILLAINISLFFQAISNCVISVIA